MLFDENPIIKSLHNNWRKKITDNFCNYFCDVDYIPLSLLGYITKSPQKYYCKIAFNEYYSHFNNFKNNNPKMLFELLKESTFNLSNANNILQEVNKENFHESILPSDHIEALEFIDKYIHYWLLRLYEGALKPLIYPVANQCRLSRNKSANGLDLFNCVEELKNTQFSFINEVFSTTIRNGIAHGHVSYFSQTIVYQDDKGNEEKYWPSEIVNRFDRLLDICNGFMCALKIFYFVNLSSVESVFFPQSILFEELQYEANSPGWKIQSCIESVISGNKKQLNIYVQNDFWSFMKVLWGSYYTAYWTIKLTKQYDRVFISLKSRHSLNGWAAFDGAIFNKNINLKKNESLDWLKEVNEDGIMFKPYYKFPKIIYKLGSLRAVMQSQFIILKENFKTKKNLFFVKDSKYHTIKNDLIIENASVIIAIENIQDIKSFIRENCNDIVRETVKNTRKNYNIFSLKRYATLKVFRIFIFDSDQRTRNRRNSGLIPELIGAISYNDKKYRFPDLFDCEKEIFGEYILFWHRKWE